MSKQPPTHTSYSPKARAVAAAVQGENARGRAAVLAEGKRATTPTVTKADVPASAVQDAYHGKRKS